MFNPNPPCIGRGMVLNADKRIHTVDNTVLGPPIASSTPAGVVHSDPTHVVTHDALSGIISDMVKQIGESVTSSLNNMRQQLPYQTQTPVPDCAPHSCLDPSQLKVVVQSEAKAPPFFRGDSSDSFPIQEWVGMMRCFLSRANCETYEEKYDLIMSRLTGKARDVVKVSLRCRPDLSGSELISAVFDTLKHHFSELTCSNMPMRDFYSTVPKNCEDAMDYWIRLNKSIDAVDECLRRRGKCVEDPSAEVVMMFISHCPDPVLSLSFQMKAPEEWTAAEIQHRLDNRVRQVKGVAANTHMVANALSSSQFINAGSAVQTPSSSEVLTPNNACGPSQPLSGAEAHQMVAMFDKVLSLCTASIADRPPRFSRGRASQRPQQRPQQRTCQVCGSSEHTTHSHCRLYRLCLNCHGPGHMRNECTQKTGQTSTTPPSDVDLN